MNLQIFDITSVKHGGRRSLRTINLYAQNGSITISSQTVKELCITTNHKILFAKDSDPKNNWYFAVSPNFEKGINITGINSGEGLKCSCRIVVDAMLQDCEATKTASFLVGAKGKQIEGVTWYQIISKPIMVDGKGIMA
jgi:hypothetical protein